MNLPIVHCRYLKELKSWIKRQKISNPSQDDDLRITRRKSWLKILSESISRMAMECLDGQEDLVLMS